jgi:hypothetical protein
MRVLNLWVVVRPAEDLPDQWVAHCLDLDVVTQGTSFQHAMKMVFEACSMVVADDIVAGRDPSYRRAPENFWTELYEIVQSGHPVPFKSLERGVDRDLWKVIAGQVVLKVELEAIDHGCGFHPSFDIPLVWQDSRAAGEVRAH